MKSYLETTFLNQLAMLNVKEPVQELVFHKGRKWRFDFAWMDEKVAVEIEGGHWTRGRHTRGIGFDKDIEKYNTAIADGWRLFRFTSTHIRDNSAAFYIKKILEDK